MQILTALLGATAIWTVAVAVPPACNQAKLDECKQKPDVESLSRKTTEKDLTQMAPEDAKQMCKEYAAFLNCMGGSEKLQECIPQSVAGTFKASDIEDICNDEDKLKAWICVMRQYKDLMVGFEELSEKGGTCEEAKQFQSEAVTSLTEKCGETIRAGIEQVLDHTPIDARFCA